MTRKNSIASITIKLFSNSLSYFNLSVLERLNLCPHLGHIIIVPPSTIFEFRVPLRSGGKRTGKF